MPSTARRFSNSWELQYPTNTYALTVMSALTNMSDPSGPISQGPTNTLGTPTANPGLFEKLPRDIYYIQYPAPS